MDVNLLGDTRDPYSWSLVACPSYVNYLSTRASWWYCNEVCRLKKMDLFFFLGISLRVEQQRHCRRSRGPMPRHAVDHLRRTHAGGRTLGPFHAL